MNSIKYWFLNKLYDNLKKYIMKEENKNCKLNVYARDRYISLIQPE